jgi:Tol biopolymer transport system component
MPNTVTSDYPNSFTADGSSLLFIRIPTEAGSGGANIYATPSQGGAVTPVLASAAYEGGAQVSPDGKWLIYCSNESGRMEVLLRQFGGGSDRKWPVSTEGGTHAIWSRDGRRIFYRSGNQVLSVDLTTTPEVRLGKPQVIIDKRYRFGENLTIPNYSLSADGREFLMVQEEPGGRHLNLVLNWLQSRNPTSR